MDHGADWTGPPKRTGSVYLNRKRLPPQETEAAKMIVDAIHSDQKDNEGQQ